MNQWATFLHSVRKIKSEVCQHYRYILCVVSLWQRGNFAHWNHFWKKKDFLLETVRIWRTPTNNLYFFIKARALEVEDWVCKCEWLTHHIIMHPQPDSLRPQAPVAAVTWPVLRLRLSLGSSPSPRLGLGSTRARAQPLRRTCQSSDQDRILILVVFWSELIDWSWVIRSGLPGLGLGYTQSQGQVQDSSGCHWISPQPAQLDQVSTDLTSWQNYQAEQCSDYIIHSPSIAQPRDSLYYRLSL